MAECHKASSFEVHGSKLKRDPLRNTGQASMVGITHGVFFFRIGKDTLNGLFAHGIQAFADIRFTYLLRSIHGILPNVAVYHLLTIGTGSALLSARTVPANLQGCCGRSVCRLCRWWYAGGLVPVGKSAGRFLPS